MNPKIDKRTILHALKGDLKSSEQMKLYNDGRIKEWKDGYEGNPYGNEVTGKSAIVSRDIKRQSEWQHASLVDPFVSTSEIIKCHPITFEDEEAARQNELLLNTQFCRKFDRFNFISKSIKVADTEGTVVVQTGWEYEGEEVEKEAEVAVTDEFGNQFTEIQIVTETIVKKNNPTAKICRNEDIYLDPTCMDDMDNAQFVIHRYETDLSSLRTDGRYKNLEKVGRSGAPDSDADYDGEDDTLFLFTDEPRKKLLVYEYWGNYDMDGDGIAEAIVCAWVGDVIIRLQTNPYPDKKPPFIVVPFNSVPFKLNGEASAELISDNQKVKTAMLRGLIDNMAQSNNGQIGLRKNALDSTNKTRFLGGKNFEYNGSISDFWQGSYNQIPGSVFDVMGLMNNEIESLSGTKSFSGGITGASLGASATGARGAMDATAVRRMLIVRNIAENLIKPLMRKWMAYNSEFLEEEEIVRITNEQYVPVRRDDLSGSIDIDITVSTAEDNAAKAQELSFLLQTIGPSEDPAIRRLLMAEILELMRMPEKAKMLKEYKPEPDPMAQEAQQLELERLRKENFLLDAKIAQVQASTNESSFDSSLKQAKTGVETEKARKLGSEADLKDLEFMMKDENVDEMNRRETFERKRKHDLDVMVMQKRLGDSVIGVPQT
jgi:hypothetical protein